MKKVRVLFYINTLDGGGAEKVLVNLVNQLDYSAFDITIKCLLGGGQNECDLEQSIHFKPLVRAKNAFIRRAFSFILYRVLPSSLFHRFFIGNNYDIEIAYDSGFPTSIIWSSKNKQSSKICFLHSIIRHDPNYLKVYGTRENAVRNYKKMDKVCFVSQSCLDAYLSEYGDTGNTMVIHNVMDLEQIIKGAQEAVDTEYDANKINIVTVGRLVPVKGYDRLLRAIHKIGSMDSSYSVTIIGAGKCKTELLDYIQNNHLDWVRILDYQQNPFPYVKNADLFLCSSLSEGYSTAVTESALIGTPVITTDCAGMKEIFSDELGGRIIENSEDAIHRELVKYLSDREYREILKNEANKKKEAFRLETEENIHAYERLFRQCLDD